MKNTPLLRMLIVFGVMIAIGIFRMPYLYRVSIIGLGALSIVNAFLLIRGRGMKWYGFRYTRTRMYLLLLLLLLPCIITRPPRVFWIEFVIWGILGMLGESLAGLYCEEVFGERLWIYRKDPVFKGHSSWLTIIPWGLGGAFFHSLTNKAFYRPPADVLLIFWTLFLVLFLVMSIGRHVRTPLHSKVRPLMGNGYVMEFFPVLGSLMITSLVSGHYQMIILALVYAVGGWVMEYFLGKTLAIMFADPLWVYLPDAMDHGHLTAWAPPLFMFCGFWFVSVSHVLTYFL